MGHPSEAIHLVICGDGVNLHLGKFQCEEFETRRMIRYVGFREDAGHVYRSSHTAHELDRAVWADPTLRTCDFCHVVGAPFEMKVRPFILEMGPRPGRFERNVAMCPVCAELVRRNDRSALVDRGVEGAIRVAKSAGGYPAEVALSNTKQALDRQVRPMVKDTVGMFFAQRDGAPFENA